MNEEIVRLRAEVERLTAMVQASRCHHQWRPVAGSTGTYICPNCWEAGGVWWPDTEVDDAD